MTSPHDVLLPERFRKNVYIAPGAPSKEYAWPRHDALDLLHYLTAKGVAVDGVEVWLPTDPGPTIPTPFIYTWGTDIKPGESTADFVARANSGAREFIATFAWDNSDSSHRDLDPYFHIETATELSVESTARAGQRHPFGA